MTASDTCCEIYIASGGLTLKPQTPLPRAANDGAGGAWLPGFLGKHARSDGARDFGVDRPVARGFDTGESAPQFDPQRSSIFIWMYVDGQKDHVYRFPPAEPRSPR